MSAEGKDYDTVDKSFADTEEIYDDIVTKIDDLIPRPSDVTPKPHVPKLKLPIIEIPTFDGDRKTWPAFWSAFSAHVHNNTSLDDVIKFTYLKSALKGEAASRIQGFVGVGSDYVDAIQLLDECYADKDAIKFELTLKILNLKSPRSNREELIAFQIGYKNTIRQLKQYVDTVDQSEWIISPLLQSKLPEEFKKYLYDRYHVNYYHLKQIDEGITDYVKRFDAQVKPVTHDRSFEHKPKQQSLSPPTATVQNLSISSKPCIFCQQSHPSRTCDKYTTVDSRRAQLEALKRCKKCTAPHSTDTCTTQFIPCKTCGKSNHHGYLCYQLNVTKTNVNTLSVKSDSGFKKGSSLSKGNKVERKSNSTPHSKSASDTTPSDNTKKTSQFQVANLQVSTLSMSTMLRKDSQYNTAAALPTASLKVQSHNLAPAVTARAFFDQGSQRTFITRRLVNKMGLQPVDQITLGVNVGFNQTCPSRQFDIVRPIFTLGNRTKRVTALVAEALPSSINTPGLLRAVEKLKSNQCVLADSFDSDEVRDIDILVGTDFYGRFMQGLTNKCGIDLIKSSAGYLIYGPLPFENTVNSSQVQNVMIARIATESYTPQSIESGLEEGCMPVHKLWELDAIGIDATAPSPQDDIAYQQYLDTLQFVDNKYYARLPWKKDHAPLPPNYKMAVGQLHALISSLRRRPDLLDHYHKIIKENVDNGFIEKVYNPRISPKVHYNTHHAVLKDSPTTPIRIVHNCSAKASKGPPSLNDCLMKGPSMTEKLANILLIFRTNKYAFSADISKAFLRVGLQEVDRDATRFLWVEDPHDPHSKLVTYRFAVVLFGATSSPFLLQATIDHHLQKSDCPYKDYLSKSFYVDNLVNTTNNEEELLSIYQHANRELLLANMPLREWTSNNAVLLNHIQRDKIGTQSSEVNILGLTWDVQADSLQLHPVQFPDSMDLTKRKLLSAVSSVFDPLGFFTPVTIMGKCLLQSAWKLEIQWDEPLPSQIQEQWSSIAKDFSQLSTFSLPRSVCSVDSLAQLVIFCDASLTAYGAVAYIVSEGESNLLITKSRVTPLKSRTLPQLELTAIQLGVQLAHYVRTTLSLITFTNTTVFNDNEAALQWIRNDNSSIPYVKNRVHHVRELSSDMKILHVSSEQNPADLLSRGVTISKFSKMRHFWFHGPYWLSDLEKWPEQKSYVVVGEIVTDVIDPPEDPVQYLFDPIICSSFRRVIRITQRVFGWYARHCLHISLPAAEVHWLRIIQLSEYPHVYKTLANPGTRSRETLPLFKTSDQFIKDLGLYLDKKGLIRSRGRLKHSWYHFNDQVLLPPKSRITHLLIMQAHESIHHGGMSETLSELRRQFWLPKGRQTVKKSLKECRHCRRILAKSLPHPGPPPLPLERVTFNRPFENTGVDFSGAITIRDELTKMPAKVYICLFTCTSSRAVHLELAKDMTASTFLCLFRRFCARFSVPKLIICDNGTNFVATEKYLRSVFQDPSVLEYFCHKKVEWKFIPPRAPWQGGFYERLIGVVKGCLRKAIYKRTLNWDDLVTVLYEIEQCVNNRPLTYVESEQKDLQPLTPNHLLRGTSVQVMPSVVTEDRHDPLYIDHELLNVQYNKLSRAVQHFVRIWSTDYLISLKEKHFGNNPANQARPIKVGEVVLVANDLTRNHWPLGRITKVFPDPDQIVRTVEVFFQGHHSLRTLDKIYPLELAPVPEAVTLDPDPSATVPADNENSDIGLGAEMSNTRPSRAAARAATERRRALIAADQL